MCVCVCMYVCICPGLALLLIFRKREGFFIEEVLLENPNPRLSPGLNLPLGPPLPAHLVFRRPVKLLLFMATLRTTCKSRTDEMKPAVGQHILLDVQGAVLALVVRQ